MRGRRARGVVGRRQRRRQGSGRQQATHLHLAIRRGVAGQAEARCGPGALLHRHSWPQCCRGHSSRGERLGAARRTQATGINGPKRAGWPACAHCWSASHSGPCARGAPATRCCMPVACHPATSIRVCRAGRMKAYRHSYKQGRNRSGAVGLGAQAAAHAGACNAVLAASVAPALPALHRLGHLAPACMQRVA